MLNEQVFWLKNSLKTHTGGLTTLGKLILIGIVIFPFLCYVPALQPLLIKVGWYVVGLAILAACGAFFLVFCMEIVNKNRDVWHTPDSAFMWAVEVGATVGLCMFLVLLSLASFSVGGYGLISLIF